MNIDKSIEILYGGDLSPSEYLARSTAFVEMMRKDLEYTIHQQAYRRACYLCRGEVEHYTTKVTYVKGLGWAHSMIEGRNGHDSQPKPIKCDANNVRPDQICKGLNREKVFMPCTDIAEEGKDYCREHSGMHPLQKQSDVEYFERTVNGAFYQCREERQSGEQRTEKRRRYDQVSAEVPVVIRHALTRRMEQRRKNPISTTENEYIVIYGSDEVASYRENISGQVGNEH